MIRGLPTSLARDGWWPDAAPPSDPDRHSKPATARLPPVLGLLLLVVFADLLFWDHRLGVSVAVFAVAMFTVATAGTLDFAALLMQANPVLARVLDINFDFWAAVSGALFWTAAAVFIAPFLAPDLPDPITVPTFTALPLARFGLNAASVLRALSLFNLMIGVLRVLLHKSADCRTAAFP